MTKAQISTAREQARAAVDKAWAQAQAQAQANDLRSLADLRPAPYNPRRISKRAAKGLAASLRHFGDISGLVWNRRTGHLVCGHQRLAALKLEHGDNLRLDGGAVVTPSGERFPVRVVDWDAPFEKTANVTANSAEIAGEFTSDLEGLLVEVNEFDSALYDSLLLDEIDLLKIAGNEVEGKEYDETVDKEVEYLTCPQCDYKWPK